MVPVTKKSLNYVMPVVIILIGVVLSIIAFSVALQWDRQKIRNDFQGVAENHFALFKKEMEINLNVLESLKALYDADEHVDRLEFRDYVKPSLLRHRDDLQALEWIPRVTDAGRTAYESEAQKDGSPDFQIKELDQNGKTVRAGRRKEYFPVSYVEPYKGNEMALGFDLAFDAAQKKYLDISRDTGKMVASGRTRLAGGSSDQFGVLVAIPLYNKAGPVSLKDLKGFVAGIFRVGAVLEGTFADLKSEDIDIHLFDLSAPQPEQLLYSHYSQAGEKVTAAKGDLQNNAANRLHYIETLDVAGRKWQALFLPTPDYIAKRKAWQPWMVLLTGILFTGLIVGYLLTNMRHEKEFWAANEQLMHEISERKTAEEELRNSKATLEGKNKELEGAYSELKLAHSQLVQQEKMASIGQLAAGVAHEINNPVGFIMSNLGSLQKYAAKLTEFISAQAEAVAALTKDMETHGHGDPVKKIETLRKSLKIDYITEDLGCLIRESLDGADRVKKIVQDLKGFSRLDEAEYKPADINAGLESTINIVWNELKYKATVKRDYGDVPMIKCNPGQLNQVFMNMLVNASHAIERQGEITVKTWSDEDYIFVSISDTGSGIPEDKIDRIFEPFYTTKEVGKGTGLGLSIAYDIVKKHRGDITVESEAGKGTTFTIRIPLPEEKGA